MSRLDRAAYRTHAAPSPTAGGLRAPRLGVKKVNGKWYISHAARFDDKEQWMRPYDTIHRARRRSLASWPRR
jgi:hypothetical protein